LSEALLTVALAGNPAAAPENRSAAAESRHVKNHC
jgi:hypothetical protein